MDKIIILGNGGHAESIVDALEREGKYEIAGCIVNDCKDSGDSRYPVIGCDSELEKIYISGIKNAAMGIGMLEKSDVRERLWKKIKEIGFSMPVICDPSAIVSESAYVGEGSFIGKGAIINAHAKIGRMCIVNTGAIVEHDCIIGDFSHVSVGTVLCGSVKVGKSSLVGANATIIQGRTVGDGCTVGAGSVVIEDVLSNMIVVGVPAKVRQ